MKRLAKEIVRFSVEDGENFNTHRIEVTEYEKICGENKEVRSSTMYRDGTLATKTENIYNDHGDLVKELYCGRVQGINTYEYNDRGRKIVQYSFFEDMEIPNRDGSNDDGYWALLREQFPDVGIEQIVRTDGPLGFMKVEWDYIRHIRLDYVPYWENNEIKLALVNKWLFTNNQFDVCKRRESYDCVNDKLLSVTRYKYDKAGNMLSEDSTEYDASAVFENSRTYTYDSNNRPLFTTSKWIKKVYKNKKIIRKDIISTIHKEFEYFDIPKHFGMGGTVVKISETNICSPTDVDKEVVLNNQSVIIKDSEDREVLAVYDSDELGHSIMRDTEYYDDGKIKRQIVRTAKNVDDRVCDITSYEYEYVEE